MGFSCPFAHPMQSSRRWSVLSRTVNCVSGSVARRGPRRLKNIPGIVLRRPCWRSTNVCARQPSKSIRQMKVTTHFALWLFGLARAETQTSDLERACLARHATAGAGPQLPRVCFLVDSGTDGRMVEGMAEHFELSILARKIEGGAEINHPPVNTVEVVVGPTSRTAFARMVLAYLFRRSREFDHVIVQGYGLAALAATLAAGMTAVPTTMLVCSPVEAYYRCRVDNPIDGKTFRRRELAALRLIARLNALIGTRYIVLSRHLRDAVRSHGNRRPIEITPIYGVDTSAFSPSSESRDIIRARRGLPANGS